MTAQQEIAPEATKVSSFWLMMGLNTGIEQDPQNLLTLQRNYQLHTSVGTQTAHPHA
jgi:hypothetical protein